MSFWSPIPTRLEETLRTALEIAQSGRPGPVVVDVPKDVQNWVGAYRGEGVLAVPGYRHRMQKVRDNNMTEARCREFFALLGESRRPLIYAGGGVINGNAAQAMRKLVLAFRIPVATTLMGLGGFDTRHPLAMHMLGMHGTAYANYAVDDCDLLIAVGARFDDRVAGDPPNFREKGQAGAALRHRSVGDSQGQAGGPGSMSACSPRRWRRSPRTAGEPDSRTISPVGMPNWRS